MARGRQKRIMTAIALFGCALACSSCSSSIADLPLGGTPPDGSQRPKETSSYLPVNDIPPNRDEPAMDPKERAKIQAELVAARDRQAATAAKDGTGK